jgi:hypothetical protein
VVLGSLTPQAAASQLQQGLEAWYPPQQEASKHTAASECQVPVLANPASGASSAISSATTTDAAAEAAVLQDAASAAAPAP